MIHLRLVDFLFWDIVCHKIIIPLNAAKASYCPSVVVTVFGSGACVDSIAGSSTTSSTTTSCSTGTSSTTSTSSTTVSVSDSVTGAGSITVSVVVPTIGANVSSGCTSSLVAPGCVSTPTSASTASRRA